ncbi:MAG: CopG-like 1 or ribbon-helix-helix domain, 5 [Paenibacillus sp.]|nr:CopG-like 1 or ribbon-helix-helix domain, 5 [Paenibacillus sp.]
MMKQFNKGRTAITLDPEVHAYVAKLAEIEDRSISQQINKIIKDYIKSQEEKG